MARAIDHAVDRAFDPAMMTEDERFMAACLRLASRHTGQTGTNPSVGTLLVRDGRIVGRGITAIGGRPHAETVALRQAGEKAKGATAYVTLEPCAHHGVTPPCAQALIDSGVSRVVTAWTDPDRRVDGEGHRILRDAGIEVTTRVCAEQAARDLAGYLIRKVNNRPQVTLKLAVSSDGFIGKEGEEVAITGPLARSYGHRIRAASDAILVGNRTVAADDPDLTCRLAGLEHRSPRRFVLGGGLSPRSRLAQSASSTPVMLVSEAPPSAELVALGVQPFAAERHEGRIALPELMEDMAAAGISTLMVEGGAQVARSFLDANLVDAVALFTSQTSLKGGIASPITRDTVPDAFILERSLVLGDDRLDLFRLRA